MKLIDAFYKIFHPMHDMGDKYSNLVGFKVGNKKLYELAFTHSSLNQVDVNGHTLNNERLEFLGDAVLELAMTQFVYKRYPNAKEGMLTSIRSSLVSRQTLNSLSESLRLENYINAKNISVNNVNIYGNSFEALLGAIFLDKGYAVAYDFVERVFNNTAKVDKILRKDQNYKSQLMEWCQQNRKSLRYELVAQNRLENNKMKFQSRVFVDEKQMGMGVGFNKRQSEQAAARFALKTINVMNKNKNNDRRRPNE